MQSNVDRPVLIIDVLNGFIRAYSAFPTMTSNGDQIGGTVGFLKTLRKLVFESQPKMVCLAWEGGGSSRRRALYSEYKLNRKPEKLNRFYEDDIPDSDENRQHQLLVLIKLLKNVPVCQLYVSDCEGDDVVAYLCKNTFRNESKIIASSDKDMLQLIDDKTKVYSFHKKTYVTIDNVLKDYRIKSENFAIAKALCGDPSDNIPGVDGIGFKKVVKLFPFLGTDSGLILQDVFSYAQAHVDESKLYNRVIESKDIIERNWRLVYLDGGMISPTQSQRIDNAVQSFKPLIDKMNFMKLLIDEGINDFNVDDFFYAFHGIEGLEYRNRRNDK